MDHVNMLRLFDSSREDLQGKFQLEEWELQHLKQCEECRHVQEVFMRQFTGVKKPASEKQTAA